MSLPEKKTWERLLARNPNDAAWEAFCTSYAPTYDLQASDADSWQLVWRAFKAGSEVAHTASWLQGAAGYSAWKRQPAGAIEGKVQKGGVNTRPSTPCPPPPKGQAGKTLEPYKTG